MVGYRNIVLKSARLFILSLSICSSTISAATLEWIGANGAALPWENANNWYDLATGNGKVPSDTDTCRVYNALFGTFTNSNVQITTTTAIAQKLQMKYLTTKVTIPAGKKLTTTGSVEMYQGTSSQIDIEAGGTFDACTKANTAIATFKLASDNNGGYTATVNVWGTLNIVSQNLANGTSSLEMCNVSPGGGTGTLNIYATGVVNVDSYMIGNYGTARINIAEGGVMTIKNNVTAQVNADVLAGKIAGVGTGIIATYNAGENKTYVTAGEAPPPPPPGPPAPPASITYPANSSTGQYTVSWALSSGASSYQLERLNSATGIWSQVYTGATASYAENVSNGSYSYRVKATNSEGSSAWTTGSYDCVVSITPPPSIQFVAGTPDGWDFGELDTDIAPNNYVDWGDLAVIAQHWLANDCSPANQWCDYADLDVSGGIDLTDYSILANDWSKQGAKTILLQTIYGTAQDSAGNITANTNKALSADKGCAMVFNVPQNTALGQGIFKCYANPIVPGNVIRVRLYNVTGKNYLAYTGGPTISKSDPGSGGAKLIDLTASLESGVYHSELGDGKQYFDMILNFGPMEVTAGDYLLVFDQSSGSNTWGSMVRGNATEALTMSQYPDGTPLPKQATVSISGFTGNTFHYELSATSDSTYTKRSFLLAFQITIANRPPSVNAGPDQTLQHPTNTANLSGTASDDGLPDPPGTFITTWSKVSGPGTVSFSNTNALNTTATFSEFGTYILRLEANDGELSRSDFVTVIYKENSPPVVNAGLDRMVGISDLVKLDGSVTDDGLPNPPGMVTTIWSKVSGPGTVTFDNINALKPSVSFSELGTYVLRLTANDSEFESYDEVTYTVVSGSLNSAPVVNAGPDRTVVEPANSISINATVTDDGNPNPPGVVTLQWTQQGGPGTVTFSNPNAANTTASFSEFGTYVLRLTANDGALESYDEVTINYSMYIYEGYAPITRGGSDGTVVHVTNLNDSGPGSLRAAIDGASGTPPGTKVVFDVSGTIYVYSWLHVVKPYITIAGETAPGNGITIDGSNVYGSAVLQVNGHDMIFRNFRVRNNGGTREIVQCDGDYNLIFDHLSISGGGDGGLDVNNGTHHIIVSRCIFYDCTEVSRSYGKYASWHHNYFRENNRRQPKIVNVEGPYDFRNNVLQYWTGTGTNVEFGHQVNIINNYWGPTDKACETGFHIEPAYTADVYISGNYFTCGYDINGLGDKTDGPNEEPSVTTMPANDALRDDVRGNSGAIPRDAIDLSIAGPVIQPNDPPVVDAGIDKTILSPQNSTALNGMVYDDGKPNPPGQVTITWSQVSGPGTVTFSNPSSASTTATFSAYGVYVLRLTASDSALSAFDEVTVTYVDSGSLNQAPVVNAGPDQEITLPYSAILDGTVTDDGLPIPPGAVTITWTKQSGPGTVTFGNANAVDTTASFSTHGVYVLRLTANDGELSTYDEITITVNPAQPPPTPGSITYPASSTTWEYTVSWSATAETISYQLERSSDSGVTWSQIYSGANTSYSELIGSGSYRYRVRAINDVGPSGWRTGTYDCVVSIPSPPVWSESADYYVDGPSGTDNGAGTSSQPFKTLRKAITVATAGKKVLVWGGQTYGGNLVFTISGTSVNPITFKRDPASGEAVIDGLTLNQGVLQSTTAAYITVDGFKLTNAKFGAHLDGDACDGWVIRNCRVTANYNNGLYLENGDNNLLFNNVVYLNGSGNYGIQISADAFNNQVVQCSVYGHEMGIYGSGGANVTVRDCISTNNTKYGIRRYGSSTVVTAYYCNAWGNGNANYSNFTPDASCISANPLFVNPAAGDFHLGSGSPSIGTASDSGDMGYRYSASAL